MFAKKSKVKNLRNVLESPFNLQWSEKNEEEVFPLQNALRELLPSAKLERTVLNFKETKEKNDDLPKIRQPNIPRTYLAPGFQSVIRSLEKKELCCVVLTNDLTPPFMQKVLMVLATNNGVPFSIIPDLRCISKSALGFATTALGFKNIVADMSDNCFYPIYRLVCESPTVCDIPFILKSKQDEYLVEDMEDECIDEGSKLQSNPETLYLYRQGTNGRVFNPTNNERIEHKVNLENKDNKILAGFISLGESQPNSSTSCSQNKKFVSKDVCEEPDDIDSDEDIFIVDTKRDNSLLKTNPETVKLGKVVSKSSIGSIKKPAGITQKGISHKLTNCNEHELKKLNNNSNNNKKKSKKTKNANEIPVHHNELFTSRLVKKDFVSNSLSGKKNKHRKKKNIAGVNFKPLKIIAAVNNTKKAKSKKKGKITKDL